MRMTHSKPCCRSLSHDLLALFIYLLFFPCTVWFADFGNWDLGSILANEKNIEILETIANQSEYRLMQSMRTGNAIGKNIRAWAALIDMDGFSLRDADDFKKSTLIF